MKQERRWAADAVEHWPLAKIIPNPRNPRTHSEAQVAQIAGSMREWGWTMPLLVDEQGMLIAGHGRLLAARQLDIADAPVMIARGWSDAQKRAYLIADNKLAMNAGWDDDLLAVELGDLKGLDFDIDLTGFGATELDALIGGWDADPETVEGHGETFEGVERRIALLVAQAEGDRACGVIADALTGAGIPHVFK